MVSEKLSFNDFPICLFAFFNDDNATIIDANSFFYFLTGYSKTEFESEKNNSFKSIIYEEDLKKFCEFMKLGKGETGYFDFSIKGKNSSLSSIKLNANVIAEGEKKIFKCVALFMGNLLNNIYEDIFQWECYKYMYSISDDIIFRYNIADDYIEFGKKYFDVFGRKTVIENFKKNINKNISINLEDAKKVLVSFQEAQKDLKRKDLEIRIRNKAGKFEWFSLVYKIVPEDKGKYCIGRLYNINKQKNERKQLIEKSQIDGLTSLYNRPATEKMVEEILESNYGSDIYALMIIDIDDFKSINDTYGHLLGDAVLADVSKIFKSTFRDTDIIGRIGGDEFLVFMNKVNSEEDVRDKAQKMCEKIRKLYEYETNLNKVSVSVGIALAAKERILYKQLFKNADLALYETKQKGKDGFTIFDEIVYCNLNSDENDFSKGFIRYIKKKVINIFEEEKDRNKAFNEILSILGNKFNPSTVYIYCIEKDSQFAYVRFQWQNKGIKKIDPNMLEMPLNNDASDFSYLSYFNREDIFYCTDAGKLEYPFNEYMRLLGTKSFLECLIFENSDVVGYIGFAEYSSQRLWVQNEVDTVSAVAEVLGSYLYERT